MSLRHRAARAFTCPRCQRTTHHPKDVENAFCPCCGGPNLPKDCEHYNVQVPGGRRYPPVPPRGIRGE
jgi:hypothetical protein